MQSDYLKKKKSKQLPGKLVGEGIWIANLRTRHCRFSQTENSSWENSFCSLNCYWLPRFSFTHSVALGFLLSLTLAEVCRVRKRDNRPKSQRKILGFFSPHHEGGQTLAKVADTCCGLSIFGGTRNTTEHGPQQPEVSLPWSEQRSDQVTSKNPSQPELFFVRVTCHLPGTERTFTGTGHEERKQLLVGFWEWNVGKNQKWKSGKIRLGETDDHK